MDNDQEFPNKGSRNSKKSKSMVESSREMSYVSKLSFKNKNQKQISYHLNLETFKTEPCQNDHCNDIKQCPFYHSIEDRRRNPAEVKYTQKLCQFEKNCLKKKGCKSSHNKYEVNYHPKNYRKKYCKHIFDTTKCQYGIFCSKAHSTEEIKVELLCFMDFNDDFFLFHYKTEFCPIEWEHNYQKCVYAHSWEDFRRNIIKYPYGNCLCQKLDSESGICKNFVQCHSSHSWYELQFHPLNYKKNDCDYEQCPRFFCPFLHPGESVRFRQIEQLQNFYIYPIN